MSSVQTEDDAWWDDLFHGAALAAFCHQAVTEHCFPPDVEATRQRAYRYYEEELAERSGRGRPLKPPGTLS